MRLRNITGSREIIAENEYVIHEPEKYKGVWKEQIFENNNPIHIEIGMGKGQFIINLAKQNPEINYIGIEKLVFRIKLVRFMNHTGIMLV